MSNYFDHLLLLLRAFLERKIVRGPQVRLEWHLAPDIVSLDRYGRV